MKKKASTPKIGDEPTEFEAWRVWYDELLARAATGDAHAQALLLARHYRDLARELPPSDIDWTPASLTKAKAGIAKAWASVFSRTPAAHRISIMKVIDHFARRGLYEEAGHLEPFVRVWLDGTSGAKKTGSGISKWKMLAKHFTEQGAPVTWQRVKKDWFEHKGTNGE